METDQSGEDNKRSYLDRAMNRALACILAEYEETPSESNETRSDQMGGDVSDSNVGNDGESCSEEEGTEKNEETECVSE